MCGVCVFINGVYMHCHDTLVCIECVYVEGERICY